MDTLSQILPIRFSEEIRTLAPAKCQNRESALKPRQSYPHDLSVTVDPDGEAEEISCRWISFNNSSYRKMHGLKHSLPCHHARDPETKGAQSLRLWDSERHTPRAAAARQWAARW